MNLDWNNEFEITFFMADSKELPPHFVTIGKSMIFCNKEHGPYTFELACTTIQKDPIFLGLYTMINNLTPIVATLALGSRPRQGVARLWAKTETRESLHMLPGVQRVWGNEPSHSQVNSHVGSWSPQWTSEFSKRDFKGQNSLPWRVLYIIEKLLKCRCLK